MTIIYIYIYIWNFYILVHLPSFIIILVNLCHIYTFTTLYYEELTKIEKVQM